MTFSKSALIAATFAFVASAANASVVSHNTSKTTLRNWNAAVVKQWKADDKAPFSREVVERRYTHN